MDRPVVDYRHCYASQTTEVDGRSLQWKHLEATTLGRHGCWLYQGCPSLRSWDVEDHSDHHKEDRDLLVNSWLTRIMTVWLRETSESMNSCDNIPNVKCKWKTRKSDNVNGTWYNWGSVGDNSSGSEFLEPNVGGLCSRSGRWLIDWLISLLHNYLLPIGTAPRGFGWNANANCYEQCVDPSDRNRCALRETLCNIGLWIYIEF